MADHLREGSPTIEPEATYSRIPRSTEVFPVPMRFPEGFRWGTATSAYQVEGNNTASDWWQWEQAPGRIRGGDRSGLACDW